MQKSHLMILLALVAGCRTSDPVNEQRVGKANYDEPFRPQLHFSPPTGWMNDPNGLVFHQGQYHLFYQHYPDSTVWGPMHWGHAVSKDLVRWENLPIALFPDSLGLIFSGSAVVDSKNTSGLGTPDNPPLVAIFTYHSMEKEKAGETDYQNQGIAFSLDQGETWTKYAGNPVLKNQGIKDFRDPKVFWHDASSKWIMTLAVLDHIELWSSPDLKAWRKLSDFGADTDWKDGVWECPDLFPLPEPGTAGQKWVLLVSTNPGGPNGGSGTRYFIGDFDGTTFRSDGRDKTLLWIDHGPDNYAGVTWENAPENRRIFMGWMSNWAYGQVVPTGVWRSAMTCPRDLSLVSVNGKTYLRSKPSPEFIRKSALSIEVRRVNEDTTHIDDSAVGRSVVSAVLAATPFTIVLSNKKGQQVKLGLDTGQSFFIDRSRAGRTDFSTAFVPEVWAPRISDAETIPVTLVIDHASVEVFFDNGITVMTSIFFIDEPFTDLVFVVEQGDFSGAKVNALPSIWELPK